MLNSITSPLDGIRSPFGPQRGFNPLRIFANDEPGVWFEANDSTTLFTDVAGTTPVTTPGDAVALQLDKSQGLVRKRDLIPNTGNPFVNTDDWAITLAGTTASIVGGRFRVESGGTGGRVTTSITGLVVGETVFVTMSDLTVVGSPRVRVTTNSDGITGTIFTETPGTGDNSYSFIATQETMYLSVLNVTANTGVTEFGGATVEAIPGNHRTQATTAARPLYALHPVGGVRNELQYTEEFDNAVWLTGGLSDLVPSLDAPSEGPSSSFVFTPTTSTSGSHTLRQNISISGGITQTVYAKASGYNFFALTFDNAAAKAVRFDLSSGTITSEGIHVTGSIELIGDGWYRVSVTIETGCSSICWYSLPTDGFTSFAGDGISGTLVAGAQLEEGSTATNYQRVGSFLDVSEEGKARRGRLWYNGTSHFMETGTITPGTDKVQVFAGVRKLSDAAGMMAELGTLGDFGSFFLISGNLYGSSSRGDVAASASQRANTEVVSGADSSVITTTHDIPVDLTRIKRNGGTYSDATGDKGTGNFLAYPIYFGARAGTSLFFNGYEDTSIVRFGPNLDETTISKVESYVASKTPASELLIPAGPELVTNGTFSTDVSGWTASANASLSLSSNALRITASADGLAQVTQVISGLTVGAQYAFSFDVIAETQSTGNPFYGSVGSNLPISSTGTVNTYFTAGATSVSIKFGLGDAALAGEYLEVDNISVRQFIPK
jgi:hypothetical protein